MELGCGLSHLSVALCVNLSVQKVYCGKTADWIRMLLGMVSGSVKGWVYQMGVVIVEGKGSSFCSEFGTSHCNQWGLCRIVVWKCVNRSSCHLGW